MNLYRRKPPALSIARFTAGCWQTVVLASAVEWGSNLSWANASTAVHQGYTSTRKKTEPRTRQHVRSESKPRYVLVGICFRSKIKNVFFLSVLFYLPLFSLYPPLSGDPNKKREVSIFCFLGFVPLACTFFFWVSWLAYSMPGRSSTVHFIQK